MQIPIVCVDERVRQSAGVFWECFSRPQRRHCVTMLVALLLCQDPRMLTNRFRTIARAGSVASRSRFLAEAPWGTRVRSQPAGAAAFVSRWPHR
jgi:hypothetical protein